MIIISYVCINQYKSNKVNMLRVIKKSNHLLKSVENESRDIISNIYSNINIDGDKINLLHQDKTGWQEKFTNSNQKHVTEVNLGEIKNNISFFEFEDLLSKIVNQIGQGFVVDICKIIFLKEESFEIYMNEKSGLVIRREQKLKIDRLRYWINHIYFNQFRSKYEESILKGDKKDKVIHLSEERQHVPSVISKNSQKLKKIIHSYKLSRENKFRQNTTEEKQTFSLVHFKDNTQQLLSFNELRNFLDLDYNLASVKCIAISQNIDEKICGLISQYSHHRYIEHQKQQLLSKIEQITRKGQNYEIYQQQVKRAKLLFLNEQKYQEYIDILTYQIVTYLHFTHNIIVTTIKLQWKVDILKNIILTNAHSFKYFYHQAGFASNQKQYGLMTLYDKIGHNNRSTELKKQKMKINLGKREQIGKIKLNKYGISPSKKYCLIKNKNNHSENLIINTKLLPLNYSLNLRDQNIKKNVKSHQKRHKSQSFSGKVYYQLKSFKKQ